MGTGRSGTTWSRPMTLSERAGGGRTARQVRLTCWPWLSDWRRRWNGRRSLRGTTLRRPARASSGEGAGGLNEIHDGQHDAPRSDAGESDEALDDEQFTGLLKL